MIKRIQRKRQKGWHMPATSVYVGRPSKWGNPFRLGDWTLKASLDNYRWWLDKKLEENPHFLDELKGKDLCCWCRKELPCHADILMMKMEKLKL